MHVDSKILLVLSRTLLPITFLETTVFSVFVYKGFVLFRGNLMCHKIDLQYQDITAN